MYGGRLLRAADTGRRLWGEYLRRLRVLWEIVRKLRHIARAHRLQLAAAVDFNHGLRCQIAKMNGALPSLRR